MAYTNINQIAGYVYVILDTQDSSRKFGYAVNVERRLMQVQTGNPHKLVIEYRLAVEDMRKAEKSIHTLFAAKRLRKGKGEWFLLGDTDIVLLKKIFGAELLTQTEYRQLESLGLR